MFQFRRFPSYAYFVQRRMTGYCPAGLPHSDIPGSMDICSSPRLFAACHVLLRLLMPRHSPCALISLTSYFLSKKKVLSCLVLFEFELCRLQSYFLEIVCFTLIKVPQIDFMFSHFHEKTFPLLLALHTFVLCSVFKVRLRFF